MADWFKNLSLSWWRTIVLKALGSPQAIYDPAALDKVISSTKS